MKHYPICDGCGHHKDYHQWNRPWGRRCEVEGCHCESFVETTVSEVVEELRDEVRELKARVAALEAR